MTKYVLNSGGIKNAPDLKLKFHQEIVKDLGKHPKVLLCNFAQGREYWDVKYVDYCDSIVEDLEGVEPTFELAMPAKFEDQVASADIVYIHGGDNHLLFYWMGQFDLDKLFDGKVIAGNSAGSCLIASAYWTTDWRGCMDGFGILPIKIIPHYAVKADPKDKRGEYDWVQASKDLKAYGDTSQPIYELKEGEYVVFNDLVEVK